MVTGSAEPEVTADGYVWQQVYSSTFGKWGWVAIAYLEEIG